MILKRIKTYGDTTFGILTDDVGGFYFTLEKTSKMVPAGVHNINVCRSERFKRDLPLVFSASVSAARGIRIHSGNSVNDTDGCILVGNTCDLSEKTIGKSSAALTQLMKNCKNTTIEVFDERADYHTT